MKRDDFRHIDFMSTVSGDGYTGASISTLMRTRTRRSSAIAGKVSVQEVGDRQVVTVRADDSVAERRYEYSKSAILDVQDGDSIKANKRLLWRRGTPIRARFGGEVTVVEGKDKEAPILTITAPDGRVTPVVELTRFDQIRVKSGQMVAKGEKLTIQHNTFADRFRWRVRPAALLQEVFSILNAHNRWVNLSDGGAYREYGDF